MVSIAIGVNACLFVFCAIAGAVWAACVSGVVVAVAVDELREERQWADVLVRSVVIEELADTPTNEKTAERMTRLYEGVVYPRPSVLSWVAAGVCGGWWRKKG